MPTVRPATRLMHSCHQVEHGDAKNDQRAGISLQKDVESAAFRYQLSVVSPEDYHLSFVR